LLLRATRSVRADWLTFGGDPQRTGWARHETAITKENVGKLKVLWKAKLDSVPKEMTSLTAPLVADGIITPRGFMELVLVAGASDSAHAIDVDTSSVFWQRKLAAEGTPKSPP
jgi:glucose dehydrogenase